MAREGNTSRQDCPYMCEGLRLMQQNLAALTELRKRHDRLSKDATQLQEEMKLFRENISSEVQAVLTRSPWIIPPRAQPVKTNIDSDNEDTQLLPPPLEPQVISSTTPLVVDTLQVDLPPVPANPLSPDPLSPQREEISINLPSPLQPEVVSITSSN